MKNNLAILNFWHTNNYGGILTCYALQETLSKLGFNSCVLNYQSWKGGLSEKFAKFNLNITTELNSYYDLVSLNDTVDTFIVGSDQVWRYIYAWPLGKTIYQLDFAAPTAKKISCAASFGQDYFEGPPYSIARIKYYLQKFDHISVREDSGIDICRDVFDVDATHILDPVFYLEPSDYDTLIKKSKIKDQNFIASYILDSSKGKDIFINSCKQYLNINKSIVLQNAQIVKYPEYSVEDWLYAIKNCNFFITDSFHGVCFALIFNKPFFCITNIERGSARFSSLINTFKINKFFRDTSNLDISIIKDIDYIYEFDIINKIIDKEKHKSIKWLSNAIMSQKKDISTDASSQDEITNYIIHKIDDIEFGITQTKKDIYHIIISPKYILKYIIFGILCILTFFKIKKIKIKYEDAKHSIKKLYTIIGFYKRQY